MTIGEEIEQLDAISRSILDNLAALNRVIESLKSKNRQTAGAPEHQPLPANVHRLVPRPKTPRLDEPL